MADEFEVGPKELLRSTVMVQDGTNRLVDLIRKDDGVYTLVVRDYVNPYGEKVEGFEVDLTQAVLWGAQWEVFQNTEWWRLIRQRITETINHAYENGEEVPSWVTEGWDS